MTPTALVAALVTALATACSASGGGAGDGPVAGCGTPGYSANEIRLGFVYPGTGAGSSSLSVARSGFAARISEANAAGGIHGRKLIYDWRDDTSAPAQNLEVVRDLVENQKVFGLVEASIAAAQGAGYLRDHGVPATGIPAEAFWADHGYRNMFAYTYLFGDGPSVSTFGDFAKSQGGTRAAVIQNDVTAAGNDIGSKIGTSLTTAGIPLVPGRFTYNPNFTNPVQLGQQLKQAGADVVTAAFAGTDLAEVVRGIREAGAPVKVILAPSGYDKSLLNTYGQTLSGLTAAVNYIPFEIGGPAHQKYLAAMDSYAPEIQPPDQEIALVTYVLTDLFLYGLDRAGACPTRAQYIDTLRASTYDAGGLLPGPVDLTKDWGQIATCYTFMRVNDAGTGYDIVPDPTGRDRWCGHRLDQ
ncbi:ABC transporter substrate-binding protein [Pseudofrankia asymbiotica]|uniref:ABC transporter substrate-binding protein n=1 Tax=Pseudofrankia asymbiotica TaxID=1834516 RepID=A0A1V2I502_9ACTN|nr:ABC transporter substrate-binding protein [Pseudofrankia asymbiotica]ONH25366.1 ABC transporter substrate-binding protein [Pseudofrankia asymbiotica]